MYGIKDFAAIVNPPQGCILAVGAGVEQPIVSERENRDRHRHGLHAFSRPPRVDGAVGAEWLQAFRGLHRKPDRDDDLVHNKNKGGLNEKCAKQFVWKAVIRCRVVFPGEEGRTLSCLRTWQRAKGGGIYRGVCGWESGVITQIS